MTNINQLINEVEEQHHGAIIQDKDFELDEETKSAFISPELSPRKNLTKGPVATSPDKQSCYSSAEKYKIKEEQFSPREHLPTNNDFDQPMETGRALMTDINADIEMGKDAFNLNTPPKKVSDTTKRSLRERRGSRKNVVVPLNLNITIPPLSQT